MDPHLAGPRPAMIVSITSSIPSFKSLQFTAGLNILLADATAKSTEKQTRNSAGKTSMIEIIHFLLGADADKNLLFKSLKSSPIRLPPGLDERIVH